MPNASFGIKSKRIGNKAKVQARYKSGGGSVCFVLEIEAVGCEGVKL